MDERTKIDKILDFWCVEDFRRDILDWKSNREFITKDRYIIGHPPEKGHGLGDRLSCTLLPSLIKQKNSSAKVLVNANFKSCFENCPDIDGHADDYDDVWGTLGIWGTTVQKRCVPLGLFTKEFKPRIWLSDEEIARTEQTKLSFGTNGVRSKPILIFSAFSNTGDYTMSNNDINNIEKVLNYLSTIYFIVQIDHDSARNFRFVDYKSGTLDNDRDIFILVNAGDAYFGVNNGIMHVAKALNKRSYVIVNTGLDPNMVVLPFLTQIVDCEIDGLDDCDVERSEKMKAKLSNMFGADVVDKSIHHLGWLYPDNFHFSIKPSTNTDCPELTTDNMVKALKKNYKVVDLDEWVRLSELPKLSIITVFHNKKTAVALKRYLAYLLCNEPKVSYEVIAVANTDDKKILNSFDMLLKIRKELKIIPNRSKVKSYASAINAGCVCSKGNVILATNTDITLKHEDWWKIFYDGALQNGGNVLCGEYIGDRKLCAPASFPKEKVRADDLPFQWQFPAPETWIYAPYIDGHSISFTRSFFEKTGGFDEEFIPIYCEDLALSFKAALKGLMLYGLENTDKYYSHDSESSTDMAKMKEYAEKNRKLFYRKYVLPNWDVWLKYIAGQFAYARTKK